MDLDINSRGDFKHESMKNMTGKKYQPAHPAPEFESSNAVNVEEKVIIKNSKI
jgi:hypothetical protein